MPLLWPRCCGRGCSLPSTGRRAYSKEDAYRSVVLYSERDEEAINRCVQVPKCAHFKLRRLKNDFGSDSKRNAYAAPHIDPKPSCSILAINIHYTVYLLHLQRLVLLPEGLAHTPLESTVPCLRREDAHVHPRPVALKTLGPSRKQPMENRRGICQCVKTNEIIEIDCSRVPCIFSWGLDFPPSLPWISSR